MSKILITGNGFDLFHGLPTKYGHFMAIMETIEKYDFSKDISFEDLFERYFKERFPYDYESIKEKYNTEKIYFEKEKINELAKLLSSNSWYKHFKSVNDIETWIDFENELENVLLQTSQLISYTKEKINGRNNYFSNRTLNLFLDFSVFNFCKKNSSHDFFIDEIYINKRTNKLDNEKVLNNLYESLQLFIKIFNNYLTNIVSVFYKLKNITYLLPINYMHKIYTFNYTPTLEKIYNLPTDKLIYLHGKINEKEELQNIILGISELNEIIESYKMYDFSKSYQKVLKRTNPNFIKIPYNEYIGQQSLFYVLGHSLDKSDDEYIKDLFKYLENDKTKMSEIIIFYYNEKDYSIKLKNLFSIMGKTTIVENDKSKRLKFVELTVENIENEFKRDVLMRNMGSDVEYY